MYRCPSLYARDREQKNMLAYNKFAYKKTKDDCKLEDRLFVLQINVILEIFQNEVKSNLLEFFVPCRLGIRFSGHLLSENFFRFTIRILRNEIGIGNKSDSSSSLVTHRTLLIKTDK